MEIEGVGPTMVVLLTGYIAVKEILVPLFKYFTGNGSKGMNGTAIEIKQAIIAQTTILTRQTYILERILEAEKDRGNKIDAMGNNIAMAMERQSNYIKTIDSIKATQDMEKR